MLTRRDFLRHAAAGTLLAGYPSLLQAGSRPQPPYRVLYSNDTTNLLSCVSPYHRKGEPFRKEMLEASVDEVAGKGVDAHFLQPGLCWVPWWKSKIYSAAEHVAWLKEKYGIGPDPFLRFVAEGGDIVQVFIDRCRQTGQAPFISFRLNDAHHKEAVDAKPGDKISSASSQGLTRFYAEHPEYRIGTSLTDWTERAHNWAIPEVRAHKFALIEELCENYDIDGFELDFLRNPSFFPKEGLTSEERCAIMTGFVRQVRQLLDRTARDSRHRWLSVRVPFYLETLDLLGIDLPAIAEAGVDMVNASAHYFTTQQHDFAAIRRMVPQTKVYFEMCHSTWNGPRLTDGYDAFAFRRTTLEQFYTSAHLAYAQGADGVSAFNFVYYREHGGGGRGPFAEPPFEVFARLRDRRWLATQPQHWFIAQGWRAPGTRPTQVPRKMDKGKTVKFTQEFIPPSGGWKKGGRLRIQAQTPLEGSQWTAILNGQRLLPSDDVSEPYANPYPPLLGKADELRAWTVPSASLRVGTNLLELTLESHTPTTLAFIDLAVS